MLYATGKRGHIVEALYVKVRHVESTQTFNYWMYGGNQGAIRAISDGRHYWQSVTGNQGQSGGLRYELRQSNSGTVAIG